MVIKIFIVCVCAGGVGGPRTCSCIISAPRPGPGNGSTLNHSSPLARASFKFIMDTWGRGMARGGVPALPPTYVRVASCDSKTACPEVIKVSYGVCGGVGV